MQFGIIIPAYQPNESLPQLLEALNNCLDIADDDATIIVVDDGSDTPPSKEIFQRLPDYPRTVVLRRMV